MNYRHAYHAGNFADVFKHTVLITLIQAMQRKDTPFCYIDTHAGIGSYDLQSMEAQKSKEYQHGIARILTAQNPPESLQAYLAMIKKFNTRYPGSPAIAAELLRPQDRALFSELHPADFAILKKQFARYKNVYTHHLNGYQGLKTFLPPKERRGLILIDPPYEQAHEFQQITAALSEALKKFSTGVFAVWYPIKDRPPIERFYNTLKQSIAKPMLTVELSIYPDTSAQHLNGNGMIIINPPWQVDEEIKSYLPFLWSNLSHEHQGKWAITALT